MQLTLLPFFFGAAAVMVSANPIADAHLDARQVEHPGCEQYSGWPWPEYTGPCESTSTLFLELRHS